MALPHAYPGMSVDLLATGGAQFEEVQCSVCGDPDTAVDYHATGEAPSGARTTALVKNNSFEAIRLVLPKGHEVCHDHRVEGPITVHCLQGRAALTSGGATRDLRAGHWLYLLGNDTHTLRGVEDSVVLLTIMFPQRT
jgi:quercetin dioxygenase-like cupin family protein